MTAEVQEYKTDPDTGLPELPEGYFWRVGEVDCKRWDEDKPRMKPSVIIVRKEGVLTKKRMVPVYGTQWWNKNQVVREKTEYYDEVGVPVEFMYNLFDGRETRERESIPEFAHTSVWMLTNNTASEWKYDVPITQEGISFLAEDLFAKFQKHLKRTQAEEEVERARREGKSKFYGDYPPKTLTGA